MAEASASESHINASRRGPCHLFEGTQQAEVLCDDPGAVRFEWNRTTTRTRVEECNANANWGQAEFRSSPAAKATEAETIDATTATAAAPATGTIAKVESSEDEQAIIAKATTIPPPSSVLAQHGKASLQPDHPAPTVTAARDSGLEASGHGGGATTEVLIKISGRAPQHGPLQISFGPHATPQTPSRTVPDVPWVIVPKQADVPWEIVAKKARPLPRVPAKALQPPQ